MEMLGIVMFFMQLIRMAAVYHPFGQ